MHGVLRTCGIYVRTSTCIGAQPDIIEVRKSGLMRDHLYVVKWIEADHSSFVTCDESDVSRERGLTKSNLRGARVPHFLYWAMTFTGEGSSEHKNRIYNTVIDGREDLWVRMEARLSLSEACSPAE